MALILARADAGVDNLGNDGVNNLGNDGVDNSGNDGVDSDGVDNSDNDIVAPSFDILDTPDFLAVLRKVMAERADHDTPLSIRNKVGETFGIVLSGANDRKFVHSQIKKILSEERVGPVGLGRAVQERNKAYESLVKRNDQIKAYQNVIEQLHTQLSHKDHTIRGLKRQFSAIDRGLEDAIGHLEKAKRGTDQSF
jgi:hypothetical protein